MPTPRKFPVNGLRKRYAVTHDQSHYTQGAAIVVLRKIKFHHNLASPLFFYSSPGGRREISRSESVNPTDEGKSRGIRVMNAQPSAAGSLLGLLSRNSVE